MEGKVSEYQQRLRERVGEGEYERHKELVILLARNLAIEDVLWEEILVHIRNIDLRTKLGDLDASEKRDDGTESSDNGKE